MTDDSNEPATKKDLKQLEDKLCSRLDGSDSRMDEMDTCFDRMDARFDNMDTRFDKLDTRMDCLESRMDSVKTELMSYMENIKDQIIRGFQLTEESIRKDCAHADEMTALETRVKLVEEQLAIHD